MDADAAPATPPTPCLVVDLDILEANIATMAAMARERGVSLRPHVKTHKCSAIARQQIAAGAIGVSCATIDEAEAMSAAGIGGLLVTSPVIGPAKVHRLCDLVAARADTRVVVDDVEAAYAAADALASRGLVAGVLIDVDVGQNRTGIAPPKARAVASALAGRPSLRLDGIQAYAGHVQHRRDAAERRAANDAVHATVRQVLADIRELLPPSPIVSGGGTGTHDLDLDRSPFTELQPGSYVFMDVQYGDVAPTGPDGWPFALSLRLRTTVVSAPVPQAATTDGGTKSMSVTQEPPRILTEPFTGHAYRFTGDEHGRVDARPGAPLPAVGTHLECAVSHCDPSVALHDRLYGIRRGAPAGILAVDARGRR